MPKCLQMRVGLRAFARAGRAQQNESHESSVFGVGATSGEAADRQACDPAAAAHCARSGKTRASSQPRTGRAHALQVVGRVDADAGPPCADVHRDALAVPQHAQLLERLDRLERAGAQLRKAPQEAGAIGVQADVAQRRRLRQRAASPRIARSRDHGIGAREKYSARPRGVEHHLDDVRVRRSRRRSSIACAAVLITQSARSRSSRAQASISAGSISGSSPCTLTTTSSPSRPSSAQASARRSLPLAWSARVSSACTPCAAAGGDDARVVGRHHDRARAPTARRAAPRAPPSARRRCRPAACRGRRVDASRAGIRTVKLMALRCCGAGGSALASARRAHGLRLRASPGCRRGPGRPGGRPGRPVHARPCCGAAQCAAAPCRSGRPAVRAGGVSMLMAWGQSGGFGSRRRALRRRSAASGAKSSAPPRRAWRPIARRVAA